MKLHHAFLMSLGIAVPLWLRQYRFEQLITREFQAYARGTNEGIERFTRGTNKNFERLNADVVAAFRRAGR